MSYVLNGLIARRPGLESATTRYQHARLVALRQDFALIPVTHELRDEVAGTGIAGGTDPYPEFHFLSAALSEWALEFSANSAVAYVEVELFGGEGTKAAIVWQDGEAILGPLKSEQGWKETVEGWVPEGPALRENPVNQALRCLGVSCGEHLDEFAALGLGRHRSTAAWR